MNVTFDDKDKNVKDGIHNYLRDSDVNEIKKAINSKVDESERGNPNGFAPLDENGKIPDQYLQDDVVISGEEIAFTPAGNISATNVQDAIYELDAEKQAALGFNPENVGNKATNLSNPTSNTQYPTVKATADGDAATLVAAKAYADSVSVSVLNYRGYWDPTGATVYPTTGGTGSGGSVEAGNTWEISVPIAAGGGHPAYDQGDLIIAKIAGPGQTAANWGISSHNTTQATELVRGTAMLATQAEAQDEATPNDIDMITPKKFWYGITRFLQVAWTFAQNITFTLAPRFSSAGTNQYLKTNGTKDLISVSSIPGTDVGAATTSAQGAAELATNTEVQTATDTTRIVTPAGLASRLNRLPVFEFSADYISDANLALSGVGQVVQGDPLIAGKVVVVAANTIATQNGIYITDAGAWLRIGVSYNNDVYNYAGNFEGTQIFVRKNKKTYKQISTAAEISSSGQNWIEAGSGSGGGSGDIFAADIVVSLSGGKTLGKYVNGDTIAANGKTAVQVLQDIAIEYINPAFTSFAITGQATSIESGDIIASGNKTFTWGTSTSINVATNSIVIRDQIANTDLATAQPNDGTQLVNIPSDIHLNGDNIMQVFRIVGSKANGGVGTFFMDLVITSFYAIFYGSVASAPNNSATVRAMTKRLRNTGNVWNLTTGTVNTVFAFWLPTGRTLVSVIDLDALNTDLTSSYVSSSLSVNDANGTPVSGTLYVMTATVPYATSHRHQITIS